MSERSITITDVRRWLRARGSCAEALAWVDDLASTTTPADAWALSERAEWLLWLAGRAGVERRALVLAACGCARLALPLWTSRYPEDSRPLVAIETAERWTRGEATLDEVRTVRRNAYAYADAAAAAAYAANDAAYAAYAAAAAAYAAAAAAYADDAAYAAYAANAAAYATTRVKARRECAAIVRTEIPWPVVEAALLRAQAGDAL